MRQADAARNKDVTMNRYGAIKGMQGWGEGGRFESENKIKIQGPVIQYRRIFPLARPGHSPV